MLLKIRKLREDAVVPCYAHRDDAGFDFSSVENAVIPHGGYCAVATGIAMEIPEGYELQIRPRSGLARKFGVTVLNSPGTIDAGYRGEIQILLINHGKEDFEIRKGDRIAQGVFAAVTHAEIELVEELSDSERGTGGFGSSGI